MVNIYQKYHKSYPVLVIVELYHWLDLVGSNQKNNIIASILVSFVSSITSQEHGSSIVTNNS